MRYQNWDVLLFPQEGSDTKTPLQEFRTCCNVVQDSNSDLYPDAANPAYFSAVTRPLPTVSCYVPSIAYGLPFRVSLHCWSPPEATRATSSLGSKDDLVVFEAKVLLDGICVAGLVFGHDARWPQIIDNTSGIKDGKPDQLRFPPFHNEMLSQAWVVPAQSMGRIKIIIAEGISHGAPGTTAFEKTRNLVTFSFQHTPMHILEDAGIAWPNPGMFYQAANQSWNPLSPRKPKETDPDSHAHSPRHRGSQFEGRALSKRDTIVPATNTAYEILPPPPAFNLLVRQDGNHPPPKYSHLEPFSGSGESVYRSRFLNTTRRSSSSGDTSMPDAPPKSMSDPDRSMPDYSRPPSPESSYHGFPLYGYSRPTSATSHQPLFLPGSSACQPRPSGGNHQICGESLRRLGTQKQFEAADRRLLSPSAPRPRSPSGLVSVSPQSGLSWGAATWGDEMPEPSQFSEMMESMSPRKVSGSGIFAPTNTRVSSAANTPPTALRPSAAAEARTLSYGGKKPQVSSITRDMLPSTQKQALTEPEPNTKSRVVSRKSDSCHSEIAGKPTPNPQKTIKKTPSANVKSKKENRSSEIGVGESIEDLRKKTPTALDKENVDVLHPLGGKSKRRRVSNAFETSLASASQVTVPDSPSKRASTSDNKDESPGKVNDIDDLTAEGVVSRAPFMHLENM